jgi:hypothetical protein
VRIDLPTKQDKFSGVRFANLSAPLDDLRPFLNGGMEVVFLDQQLSVDPLFCQLFRSVFRSNGLVACTVYFPESRRTQEYQVKFCVGLRKLLLSGSDFFSDFYMVLGEGELCFYNSVRDDFSVFFVSDGVLSVDRLLMWDAQFSKHLISTGIGFGRAGYDYANDLLGVLPSERLKVFKPRYRSA